MHQDAGGPEPPPKGVMPDARHRQYHSPERLGGTRRRAPGRPPRHGDPQDR